MCWSKKQDIYYFTSYISVSSKRLNLGPSNHRPLDAASVCEESRNGLQTVLHICICVHIYVYMHVCVYMYVPITVVCINVYTYMCMCMCVYMYVYMCMYCSLTFKLLLYSSFAGIF